MTTTVTDKDGVWEVNRAGERLLIASTEAMEAIVGDLIGDLPERAPVSRMTRLRWRFAWWRGRQIRRIHDLMFGACDECSW